MSLRRSVCLLLAVAVGVAGVSVAVLAGRAGQASAQTSCAGVECQVENPPTCTTQSSVTVNGICEDVPDSIGTLTDTGDQMGQGVWGGLAFSVWGQVERLITDNLTLLLTCLGCALTFLVLRYLFNQAAEQDSRKVKLPGESE